MLLSVSREEDEIGPFGTLVDHRSVDKELYYALDYRIYLRGLTLEITAHESEQGIRWILLTDGRASAGCHVNIYTFEKDGDKYCDHIAHQLVMAFARERYLRKR